MVNKQEFVPELVNAVKEYYLPHRDTMLHLVRFVCDAEGSPLILVRFCDERGIRRSALVSFFVAFDDDGNGECTRTFDAREEMSVVRTRENDLINWYTSAERFTKGFEVPSYVQVSHD